MKLSRVARIKASHPSVVAACVAGIAIATVGCDTKGSSPTAPSPVSMTMPPETAVQPAPPSTQNTEAARVNDAQGEPTGDANIPSAANKRIYVVAALGDSITDTRGGGGGYLEVLREACPQSTFLNYGKGGDMTNQMLRRAREDLVPEIEEKKIDTLLVYGGVNDLYSDLTAGRKNSIIERDLASIYRLGRRAKLRTVVITVSPWGGFSKYWNPRRGENTRLLNSWILGQVGEGRVDAAIDSYTLLSCGKPERLCDAYQSPSKDGLHPGKKGHELLGQRLAEGPFSNCL